MAEPGGSVLVTGAGGRVGAQIVDRLADTGWRVVGIDRPGVPTHPAAATWLAGDITEREHVDAAMATVDAVVHTVVAVGEPAYETSGTPFRVNVAGTYGVLDIARRHGVRRVVHLSEAPVHLPATAEDRSGSWRSAADDDHLYDLTKRLQEEICRDFADTFGLDVLALRIGHVVDGLAKRDLRGRSLDVVDYCRGGWVCCHDVARVVAAGLAADVHGFVALPVVGSRQGRERFDVTATETALGVQLGEAFDDFPAPAKQIQP
jgi:nucleoside-diphosphate-sugar epimerase